MIRTKSRIYETPAFPPGSGPAYLNAVIEVEASWSARQAITHMHEIEAEMGRRRQERWEARHIDLDLLAIGREVRPDMVTAREWMTLSPEAQKNAAPGQLILPHPRLHERAFVLVPLAEVAPDWMHPVLRRTAAQMRDDLPKKDLAEIVPTEKGWG